MADGSGGRADSNPSRPLAFSLAGFPMEKDPHPAAGSASDPESRRNVRSPIRKHDLTLAGRRKSVSLEDQFWDGLKETAASEDITTSALVERIAAEYTGRNLSSAIRVFVLNHFRTPRAHRA